MSETEQPEGDDEFEQGHRERQANRKVRVIKVPHFGKKRQPLTLYAYPLTINDVIHLDTRQFASQAEQNIMQLIRQCMDAKCDPYWTLRNKTSLMNEPADISGEILVALNGATSTFTEVLKKNKQ